MATRTEWGEESLKNAIGAEGLGWVVCALNAHDDLVAALHDIRRVLVRLPRNADERLRTLTLTDAALAKAEPER